MAEQTPERDGTATVLVRGIDARLYDRVRQRTWRGNPSATDVIRDAVNRGMAEWLAAQQEGRE